MFSLYLFIIFRLIGESAEEAEFVLHIISYY